MKLSEVNKILVSKTFEREYLRDTKKHPKGLKVTLNFEKVKNAILNQAPKEKAKNEKGIYIVDKEFYGKTLEKLANNEVVKLGSWSSIKVIDKVKK